VCALVRNDPPGDGRRADEGIGPYGHTDLGVGPDAPIGSGRAPVPRRFGRTRRCAPTDRDEPGFNSVGAALHGHPYGSFVADGCLTTSVSARAPVHRPPPGHCEERSDVAIRSPAVGVGNLSFRACICDSGCGIIASARIRGRVHLAHAKKANTRRVAALRVFILCLAALTPAVKPLANIVANYARCDSQQELAESTHFAHLPLLPGFSEKEGQYHKYTRIRRVSQERGLRIPTPVCALVRNDPAGGFRVIARSTATWQSVLPSL
jgi:hypothetical protein